MIHPDKGILFCQCNDGSFHFIKSIGGEQPFHDEQETIKMRIVNISVVVLYQQRLFPLVEGRLLLKKAVIDPASVGAQVADDRHAVHVASEDESPFVKAWATASFMGCSEIEYKNEMSDMVNRST